MTSKKALVITIGPPHDKPWWWDHIEFSQDCEVDYYRLSLGDKKGSMISTRDVPYIMLMMLKLVVFTRNRYDYVFTFECDMTSFVISFFQTLFFQRKPKHVILTFIMREKQKNYRSKFKYMLMRFIFRSLHKAICSSQSESRYYNDVFGWVNKAVYVPLLCAPEFLADTDTDSSPGDYIISAGRTFRDFDILINAVNGTDVKLVIVTSPGAVDERKLTDNIRIYYDLELAMLNELIRYSRFVVVTLEPRMISTGQSVILQAMAMNKAVIATRTSGTVDYIEHDKTGILVNPNDNLSLRNEILRLYSSRKICDELAENAKNLILTKHSPQHYYHLVASKI